MSFGAIAGAIAGGIASGGAQSAFGLYSSSKAWRREREAMQKRHQWEVADLRKAGLNPVLSAGGSGTPGGSASIPSSPNFDIANSALAFSNLKVSKNTADKIRQDTNTGQALERQADAQTAEINARTSYLREQNKALARENRFYSARPDLYEQTKIKDSGNGFFGQLLQGAGVADRLTRTNSARVVPERKKSRHPWSGYVYSDSK